MAIALGHKGKTAASATCIGREGHSALAPLALNAVHLACDLVAEIRRAFGSSVDELDARAVVTAVSGTDPRLPPQVDGSLRAQLWPHRHNTDAMSISLLRRV